MVWANGPFENQMNTMSGCPVQAEIDFIGLLVQYLDGQCIEVKDQEGILLEDGGGVRLYMFR
jgi:hypothetical protein